MSLFNKKQQSETPTLRTPEKPVIEHEVINRVMTDYDRLLPEVQEYMSSKYASAVYDMSKSDMFRNCIKQYIVDKNYYIVGKNLNTVVDELFSDMAEFSLLTPYLKRLDVEEINVNAWDDIQIIPADGKPYKIKETFKSPEHCIDIIKRLLHDEGKMSFDESRPIAKGFLKKNIRVTAVYSGIVDKERGAVCSIRIVNPKLLTKSDFIKSGTCNDKMYRFLSACFIHGISECFAGETGSGKTTIMSDIMTNYPVSRRIITIESETREFNLVRRDENGKTTNNVIHMITRDSDDKTRVVTQLDLLTASLTMNPDALCMAEIKEGGEAWGAQEAARTGHAVMTTTHANSTAGIYTRLATLCIQEYSNIPYATILQLVAEAFPIAVYQHKFEDGVRRVTEIAECNYEDGRIKINSLWKFCKTGEKRSGGEIKIEGVFKRVGEISDTLKNRLYNNGFSAAELNELMKGD